MEVHEVLLPVLGIWGHDAGLSSIIHKHIQRCSILVVITNAFSGGLVAFMIFCIFTFVLFLQFLSTYAVMDHLWPLKYKIMHGYPKCGSCYKAIIMIGRPCFIEAIHIYYAHPDMIGLRQLVCFLSPHSSAILIMLYALMLAWALFGFLKLATFNRTWLRPSAPFFIKPLWWPGGHVILRQYTLYICKTTSKSA